VDRRNRHGVTETERQELPEIGLCIRTIHLVRHQQDRAPRRAQPGGNRLVVVAQPCGCIDEKHDEVSPARCSLHLATHLRLQRCAAGHPTAGVNHIEVVAAPFDFPRVAVAGDPRFVFNDRRLFANEAIEERALADVRSSDDDDVFTFVALRHLVQATEHVERYR